MTQITERQHIDAEEVDDKLIDNLFDTPIKHDKREVI